MLLKKFAAYLKTVPDEHSFQVALQGDQGEEFSLPAAEPTVAPEAEIVEGSGMELCPVGAPSGTCFTHFLDGAQDTRRIGFYRYTAPILYGFIGAVIRERNSDRCMSTYDKVSQENLYFSFAHLDSAELRTAGIECRDASEKPADGQEASDVHPLRLLEVARRKVSNDRAELERGLAERWIAGCISNNEWLLWDGSITSSIDVSKHPRVVGVVKSHQTQYFTAEDQRRILSLKVGERSSVFKPRGRGWSPVYSWYLRLHPNAGRDVYFGLIRVEAAAARETVAMADKISRWLLSERSPLSLPDGRWDRMIYPIRDCEQYLRSIAPSKIVIEAALAGL